MSTDRVLGRSCPVFRQTLALILAVAATAALFAKDCQAGPIVWNKDLGAALQSSAEQEKPVMVMVGARWCGHCHQMLQQTFPDPALAARVNAQFVPVLLDADEQAALVQKLRVSALPTVLVISPERKIVGRFTGYQSAAQLGARLAPYQRTRPAPVPQAAASKLSFHDRAWSAIRAERQRDTAEAAKEFSAGR